jgi:hypothetical protein
VAVISSEDAFAAWAPESVRWSDWAKPVIFVQATDMLPADPLPDAPAPAFAATVPLDSAVVVDLPGAESVQAGLALAARGFRPVPLFNGTDGPSAVIDVRPIVAALGAGVDVLRRTSLAPEAPPAFLLDARRNGPFPEVRPGSYDNRWVTLPQDFPSASLLISRGIRTASIVQHGGSAVAPDLAHTLKRWQDHGIRLQVIDLDRSALPAPITVTAPSGFKLAWYAAIAVLGLRRSNVGGFGAAVPEQTSSSGFHG